MELGNFFTRTEQAMGLTSRSKITELSAETLNRLGLRGVAGMNPRAKNPNIPFRGSKHPKVLCLLGNPTPADDEDNKPFSGIAGRFFRDHLSLEPEDVRYGHVVRTLPKGSKGPIREEIECYRPSLVEEIERRKPMAIVGCGKLVLDFFFPGVTNLWKSRGRRFVLRVGSHVCWFYPVEHPVTIYEKKDEERSEKKGKMPGKVNYELFKRDLRRVAREIDTLKAPEPVITPENINDGIIPITGKPGDLQRVADFLAEMSKRNSATLDTESNRLRPYGRGAKLLCIGIGHKRKAMSIALDHREARWTEKEKVQVKAMIKLFLSTPIRKKAQNLKHDLEWLYYFNGEDVLRPGPWDDTMTQAFQLDERKGTHGLNFLTALHFGLAIKDQAGVDRNRLDFEPLDKVLMYNGRDVKVTDAVEVIQRQQLKDAGLLTTYKRDAMPRIPTLVVAQHIGFPVRQKRVRKFQAEYQARIDKTLRSINRDPDVITYRKRNPEFDPANPHDLVPYYRDFKKRKEGRRGQGKYSTDKAVLKAINDKLARNVLKLRKVSKGKSTYVDPLDISVADTVVFHDGRVHTNFNIVDTATSRLSSDDPNMQNYPKRDPELRKLRSMFVPPEDCVIVSVDFGSIQVRCIAMESKDPVLVKHLWTEYDTHKEWAERLLKVIPEVYEMREARLSKQGLPYVFKDFRNEVKNQMVFPAFFGSSLNSIARDLETEPRKIKKVFDAFWREFAGVKRWQLRLQESYKKHFYVQNLFGGRRYGPLTWNKVINSPIQGDESNIVMGTMSRMSEFAQQTGRPWLNPFLNIHDDLEYPVPRAKLRSSLMHIVRGMTNVPMPFINVPIVVEVEVGKDWGSFQEFGKSEDKTKNYSRFASNEKETQWQEYIDIGLANIKLD